MTNKCYAYSTLKVKDILHWRTSRPQEFPFPGISEVQIQPKSGLVWSYFDDDYDDYGDYDDYDNYDDYDDDYDNDYDNDYDGDYDVLHNLTQNSHSLLHIFKWDEEGLALQYFSSKIRIVILRSSL